MFCTKAKLIIFIISYNRNYSCEQTNPLRISTEQPIKNLSKNPSSGIGLNPNLNIEDEYIQNLLKQVHFLSMEIKKEKQSQNKGMGIMGILNKDQNPVVNHAVTSNEKYTDMKSQLSQLVNTAEVDHFKLDDENFSVKAQRDLVEKLSLKEEQKNIQHKLYVDKVLGENREKMNEQLKRLKELREDHRRNTDNFNRVHHQWEDLTLKSKTKNLMKNIGENLEGQTSSLREGHAKKTEDKFKGNQDKIDQAYRLFKEDPSYGKLVEEQKELKEKIKVTDKELFDKNYLVKEMDEKKKLSIRNRDVEAELKKQAIEESERMKKKLADRKGQMEVRYSQAKAALESNDEVRLVKGKLARRQKEINDLKKKTEVSETNFKRLRDEVQRLEGNVANKKQKNEDLKKKLELLKTVLNEENGKLRQSELNFEKNTSDHTNLQTSLKGVRKNLEEKEEELSYLTAKEDYLHREVNLDDGLKNIKIEQLSNLMHSNTGLNSTITSLMEKWDQIIKFSREPPSTS